MVILSSCGQNFHLTGFKLDAGVTLPAGGVEVGQNYNLEGDCEPNGATVTLESPDFTPSPVTATCVDGRYRVADPVQFTGSGPNGTNPKIMVSIDDGRGPPVEREEVTLINNTLPVIADDNANTTFGNAVTVDVDLNDSDPDGTLNLPGMSILTQPPVSEGVCALTGAPNYDITFTPAANFAGNSSCVYELCDNAGLCDQASLTVTVDPGATPVATDDTANTPYNTPVTVDVQLNDTDNNLDPSSTSITVQPPVAQGVCAVGAAPNYDVTFTPVAGFEGVSSCTYQICDLNSPNAQCDTATISVTVAAGVAPVANNDTSSGLFGAAQTIDPLPNDTDANGDIDNTSVTIDTNANTATEGTCTAASPNVTFTPVANFAGNATCTYQVCDDTARCDTADIVFTVAPGAAPVATDDTGSGNFGDPIVVDVQGNDTDADGNFDPSSTTIATQPPVAEGVCAVGTAPNYDVTFTPATGFNGNSTCTYSICDANMPTPQCDTADVVFTVGAGSAPVANNDTVTTDPNVAVATDVSANDTDADGNLDNTSVTLVGTQPNAATEGSCSVASPNVTFTPVAAYLGGDLVCEYQICDSNSPTPQCDTASLTITVDGDPAATDDTGSGTFGTPVVVDVQANDTEPNGDLDPSTTTISTQPPVAEGVCAVGAAPNYDVTFTPATNFAGTSTCTYQICDGSTPANCDTADITITVGAGSAPVATDDTGSGNFGDPIAVDVQGNDTDADGNLDPSSTTISTQPPVAEGVCAVGGAPNYDVTFTPAANFTGNSTCTYQVCDANMPTPQCDTADVVFTVGTGSAPVAGNDVGAGTFGQTVTVDVQANDTDADGNLDPSSTTIDTQPPVAEGVCSVGAAPAYDVSFVPASGFNGTSSCVYEICDANIPTPQCDTASLTVTIGSGSAPLAGDDVGSGNFGDPIVVDVQANDTDPDGNLDPSSTSIDTQPPVTEGVCAVGAAPNYDITFTPAANYAGNSTCTYEICDLNTPTPQCDTADVVFTVGAGATPVANDDTATTDPNVAVATNVATNDTDADGNLDNTSVTLVGGQPNAATEGSCSVASPNVTFTPVAAYLGGDVVCNYQICDSNTPTPQCDTAALTITVDGDPVAVADVGGGNFGDPITVDVQANDTEPNGDLDPSTTTISTQPPVAEGVCAVGAAPNYDVTFTPAANFAGNSTCTYQICDGSTPANCDTADVVFTVGPGATPVATDDTASGNFGDPIVVDVQANDTDPDANLDPSSTSIDTQPPVAEGVCAVGGAPNYDITFTPAANYAGNSTCTYEICDLNTPTPQCDTADVVFTVGAGAAPVANDDTATTDPNVAVATNVATNDTDADGNLDNTSVTLVGGQPNAATEGSCSVASPNVTFTPVAAYLGGDVVCNYQICDSNTPTPQCDTASLTITVDGDPVAVADVGGGNFGDPITVDVQANDTEPNGDLDPSTTTISTQPPAAEGVCAVGAAPNYDVTFTPAANFAGNSTCTYQICDGSTPANCDTADVVFTVAPGATPVATDDTGSGNFGDPIVVDVQVNDTDADGNLDPSSTTISTQPPVAEGVCAVGAAPSYDVTFTPAANYAGNSTCTYQICDSNTPTPQCDTADVVFTVGAGATPVANDDTAQTNPGVAVVVDVVGGTTTGAVADTDADSNLNRSSLSITTNANAATEGTCAVTNAPLSDITFTPVPAFTGVATCTYEVCDSNTPTAQCDTAVLTLTVFAPPVANDDSATDPNFGDPVVIAEAIITTNDTAGSGTLDASTISIDTNANAATEGTCAVSGTSPYDITFTPIANFVDTATCTYEICNTNGLCDTADITFDPANGSAPVANDDTANTSVDTAVTIDVTAGAGADTDADGNLDSTSVTITTNANPTTEGTCTVASPNVTFTPVSGYIGTATCTYQVCDSNLNTPQCDTADIDFVVAPACGAAASPIVFNYTGSDQSYSFSTDSSVTHLHVKAWGAGGGADSGNLATAGPGGFTEAVLSPSGGDQFSVMVGRGGTGYQPGGCGAAGIYGFGGCLPSYPTDGNGGGLSGLFTGTAAIAETDQTRAVLIAGGGGGGDYVSSSYGFGGSGNDPVNSGGETNMTGRLDHDASGFYAGGGGGYNGGSHHTRNAGFGGLGGNGGSGFIVGSAVFSNMLFTPEFSTLPPEQNDTVYVSEGGGFGEGVDFNSGIVDGGDGLVVLTELCAGNDNPPYAAVDRVNTLPNTSVTQNVGTNDADIDGDLDLSSISIDVNAPAAEGSCTLGSNPGEIDFTPAAGFTGPTSCVYEICDSSGTRCDTASFEIEVITVPVAEDDAGILTSGTTTVVDVDLNDTDEGGDLNPSTINITSNGSEGTCTVGAGPDYDVTYTLTNTSFKGEDTCTYQICDLAGNCDTADLTVYICSSLSVSQHIYSGANEDVTPPADATNALIKVWGAGGGDPGRGGGGYGGPGGYLEAVLGINPSDDIDVAIGERGAASSAVNTFGGGAGGGAGTPSFGGSSGGGGSSVIVNSTTVMIAGGGGGSGAGGWPVYGGPGGGIFGEDGSKEGSSCASDPAEGGLGGTPTAGGAGGTGVGGATDGLPGALGIGGVGGTLTDVGAGGGGGGYYGGGGGGRSNVSASCEGGGGGGSSFCTLDGCVSLSSTLPTVNPPQSGDANRPTNAGRSSNDGGVAFEWLRCEVAPPVAVNDTSSGLFGANQTVTDVTSNDAAGDNPIDTASVTIDTNANAATEGTCSVTTSPAVQFVPVANFAGDATCTYQVCDNGTPATCDTADVTFTVGAGSAPVANDDTVGTPQGVAIVVDVVGGSTLGAVTDTDADSNLNQSSLNITTNANAATEGSCAVTNAPLSDITFTPVPAFAGATTCTYEVCDSNIPTAQCDTAVLTINVNAPPVANADTANDPDFGDPVVIAEATIMTNDTAGSGTLDASTISIDTNANAATEGTCAVSGTSPYDITFTPIANFVDTATCTYEICNTNGLCDTADITFDPANGSAPVANNDATSTIIDNPVVIDVTAGAGADTDVDGNLDTSSVTITANANPTTEGTCTVSSPNITFTPVSGYLGTATCTYQVCDSNLNTPQCDTADVVFTVNAACEAKTFSYEYVGADQYYPFTNYPNGDTTRTNGNSETLEVVTSAGTTSGGTIDSTVTHIHVKVWGAGGAGGVHADSHGGPGGFSSALIPVTGSEQRTIVVGAGTTTTSSPIYGFGGQCNGNNNAGSGGGLSGIFENFAPVLSTDISRALLIAGGGGGGVGSGYHGTGANVNIGGAGGHPDFSGGETDMLGNFGQCHPGVLVASGGGGHTGGLTHTRQYSGPDAWTAGEGGSSYVDLAFLSRQIKFTPGFSRIAPENLDPDYLSGVADGALDRGQHAGDGLVIVTELCAGNNNAPIASDDVGVTTVDTNATFNVGSNDVDIDGDLNLSSITIDTDAPAAEGTCTVGSNPGEIDFAPASGFNGPTSCVYQICDASGTRCDTATLEIQVAVPPVAVDDSATGNSSASVDVSTNDTVGDNPIDLSSVTITTNANPVTQGTCAVSSPTVLFTPVGGFLGTATCSYEICDTVGLCDTADIDFTITACGASLTPLVYNYTGTDQDYSPSHSSVTHIRVKAWGAGGGNQSGYGVTSGSGGYTEALLGGVSGDYKVIVGQGGTLAVTNTPPTYGFGGSQEVAPFGNGSGQGGGLSGLFSGAGTVSSSDQSRALVIAGGGGSGDSSSGSGDVGNSSSSGGMPDMQGFSGFNNQTAGGGGYTGGLAGSQPGLGGSAYVDPSAVNYEIVYSENFDQIPPSIWESEYANQAGEGAITTSNDGQNGLVVITEICGGDQNEPFAAADFESTFPRVDVSTIVTDNDTDLDGDLDVSSLTIAENAPVAEGVCTLGSNPGEIEFSPAVGFSGYTQCRYQVCDASGTRCDQADFIINVEKPVCTKILASDGAASDNFGWQNDIDVDTMIVASLLDDDVTTNTGSAYIYNFDGTNWTQTQKLTASDAAASDYFGQGGVAISGEWAIVGSPLDDDVTTNTGSVYVYRKIGTVWIEYQKLTASDAAASDYFGGDASASPWLSYNTKSVDIEGNVIAVGAHLDDDNGTNSGSVYIFEFDGTSWVETQKLTQSDGVANDYFGRTLSLNGDRLAVGSFFDDDGASDAGSVVIFEKSGATWSETHKVTASDPGASDYFGNSLSLHNDRLVVGAYFNDDTTTNTGSAYVFDYNSGTDSWDQSAKLNADDPAASDQFGYQVSVWGDRIMVGAQFDDDLGTNSGSVYAFERNSGTGNWEQVYKLDASGSNYGNPLGAQASDYFGVGVALSERHVVVGLNADDDNGTDAGASCVFEIESSPFAPVAHNDDVAVAVDVAHTFNVTDNDTDSDLDLDPSSITITTNAPAAEGSCTVAANPGEITFTPASGFFGATSCEYQVCDGTSPTPLCDTATIDIFVEACSAQKIAFLYTGEDQPYTPTNASVTHVEVKAWGAAGGGHTSRYGGGGAFVNGQYAVAVSDSIDVIVGEGGKRDSPLSTYGGGGAGGDPTNNFYGSSGGGLSGFRINGSYVAIAGAGGGATYSAGGNGGAGGALVGENGTAESSGSDLYAVGQGGTQSGGGRGGQNTGISAGSDGGLYFGGAGGIPVQASEDSGGGGGSGYYGGGGGIGNRLTQGASDTGGGGGSSFCSTVGCSSFGGSTFNVAQSTDGDYLAGVGQGAINTDGGNGYVVIQEMCANINDHAPFAANDRVESLPDDPITTNVLANDLDVDGDLDNASLSIVTQAPAAEGVCSLGGTGEITFTPVAGFRGVSSCEYEVCDTTSPTALCSTALYEISIEAPSCEPIIAQDGAASDNFGLSQSSSGDFLAIGSHLDDDKGSSSGSVYIYQMINGVWTQTQKLTASDGQASDEFGRNLSMYGEWLVVGAHLEDQVTTNTGAAYVFRLDRATSNWYQHAKLIPSDGASTDNFGYSVSVSGNRIAVSSYLDDDNGSASGSAYIYEYDPGLNIWNETAKVTASDGAASDNFGFDLALEGDRLLVGSFQDDDNGSASGSAYVYDYNGTTWVETQKLTAGDGVASDNFGRNVALSGDRIVIGAHLDDDNGSASGSAYVFELSGTWTQTAKLTSSDGVANDHFAYGVSIKGDHITVGAYQDDDGTTNTGSSYHYIYNGSSWDEVYKFTKPFPVATDNFGWSTHIAGNYTFSSIHLDDGLGSASGAVCAYDLSDKLPVDLTSAPIAMNDASTTPLGTSVTNSVWSNDLDPDGDIIPATVTITSNANSATEGTCSIVNGPLNEIQFTPVANFSGSTTCQYQVCDSTNKCDTADFNITVNSGAAPIANDDTQSTTLDVAVEVDVVGNDTDADNNLNQSSLSITSDANNVTEGSCSITSAPLSHVTFTPVSGFLGTASCTYQLCDSEIPTPQCDTADLSVTVVNSGTAPVASDDSATGAGFGDAVTIADVTSNDTDVDANLDTSSVTVTIDANTETEGTCEVTASPSLRFTPVENFSGNASCTYQVCDATSLCDTAIATFTVPVGAPPVVENDLASTLVDQAIIIPVTNNDSDADDNLDLSSMTITLNANPTTEGTCAVSGSDVIFTPVSGFIGSTSCVYQLCDSEIPTPQCDNATIDITVNASCNAQTFAFDATGSDQNYVPSDSSVSHVFVKLWGAGGGGDKTGSWPDSGGAGAFASGLLSVGGVSSLLVVVGEGGDQLGYAPYGGGGSSGPDPSTYGGASGGGLSGVFSGGFNQADALIIAGAGGGANSGSHSGEGRGGFGGVLVGGDPGTDPSCPAATGGTQAEGGQPGGLLTGIGGAGSALAGGTGGEVSGGDNWGGGGGAGYFGGGGGGGHTGGCGDEGGGAGGSSFIDSSVIAGSAVAGNLPSTNGTQSQPAMTADADYNSDDAVGTGGGVGEDGGPGQVVFVEYCAGNNNPPFAGDDTTEALPDETVTEDVLANDIDIDGDLDSGSLSIVSNADVTNEGTCSIVNGELEFSPVAGFVGTATCTYQVCDSSGTRCDQADWMIEVDQPICNKFLPSDGVASDYFGSYVDVDGDRAIVSSFADDDNGSASGSVYIYEFNGNNWVQQQKLVASDGVANDNFGMGVQIYGDMAVVAAPRDDDNGSASGSVYVFEYDGSTWAEVQKITASDGAANDYFGGYENTTPWSAAKPQGVSLDDDVLVVGANGDDDNGSASGSAYVFIHNGVEWIESQKLTQSDGVASDEFGWSVSVDSDRILVGSPYDDDNGSSSGSAILFEFNGTTWVETVKLTSSDGAGSDFFGTALSISEDFIAVGAYGDDDNGSVSGSVYMFEWDGSSWVEIIKLVANDGVASDWFGFDLDLEDNRLLVSSHNDDDNGSASGSAYYFEYDEVLGWQQRYKIDNSGETGSGNPLGAAASDYFGTGVALGAKHAIVGVPGDDDLASAAGASCGFLVDEGPFPPNAIFDYVGVSTGIAKVIDVLENDEEADGDLDTSSLRIVAQAPVAEGVCSVVGVSPFERIEFTPAGGFGGVTSCSYEVCDSLGLCDQANIYVAVAAPPIAVDDTSSGVYQATQTVSDVTSNDSDGDNPIDPASVTIFSNASAMEGVCSVSNSPEVEFIPHANFSNATATCVYEVCDTALPPTCATANLDFTVGVGNSPMANNDMSYSTDGVAVIADVVGATTGGSVADSDPDDNLNQSSLSIVINANAATEGTCSIVNAPLSEVQFAPVAGFAGTATCTYEVCDASYPTPLCDTANLDIAITTAPIANNDTASGTVFNGDVVADVDSNDTATDGALDPSTIRVVADADNVNEGRCFVGGAPSYDVSFRPVSNFTGTATCDYEICDQNFLCDTATITFDAHDGAAPIANDDSVLISQNTSIVFNVSNNDTDPDGNIDRSQITIQSNANPATEGTCSASSGSIQFTPVAGYIGATSCTYEICDLGMPTPLCDTATFNVTVNGTCDAAVFPIEFSATGADQNYSPSGSLVTHLRVQAWGAGGGGPDQLASGTGDGGNGGYVEANVSAPSGSYVVVVGEGGEYGTGNAAYGGGGSGGSGSTYFGGGGGGMSGLFDGAAIQANALVIAGGAGGQSGWPHQSGGGHGGGLVGTDGKPNLSSVNGGGGASQIAGGIGINDGTDGSALQGGDGGNTTSGNSGGGGGGGGYFGGGGGSQHIVDDTGGGAGSGFCDPSLSSCSLVAGTDGGPAGTSADNYLAGIGVGGALDEDGGDGRVVITELCAGNNNPPIAVDDDLVTDPSMAKTIDVSANDSDIDGDLDIGSISIESNPPAGEGTCSVGANPGEVLYTPDAGFTGQTSCEYEICDSSGIRCDTATINIDVPLIACNKFTPGDGAASDNFGWQVDVEGDRAIVSSHADDDNGSASGSAYIFEFDGTNWVEMAKLTPSDGAGSDYFGISGVALSGNRAIIAAGYDDDNGSASGSVYVFEESGGSWSQTAKLTASDGAASDYFGGYTTTTPWSTYNTRGIDIDGDTIVVGAYGDDDVGTLSGSVYIFDWNGSAWVESQKLLDQEAGANDEFGKAVSLSGDKLVVSAHFDDEVATNSGAAIVFHKVAGAWIQVQRLTASDAVASDYFGNSVAVDGNRVVVGSYSDDDNGSASGSVYVFEWSGSAYAQTDKLLASDGAASDWFGYSVAIRANDIVVGAHNDDDYGSASGSAYVFSHNGSGWDEIYKIDASGQQGGNPLGAQASDYFAGNVAIGGKHIIAGLPGDDDVASAAGASCGFLLNDDAFAPFAVNDTAKTGEESSVEIDVLQNDSDVEGDMDSSTLRVVTDPPSGEGVCQVSGANPDEKITFTPDAGFKGATSCQYEICDATGLCSTATISIQVGCTSTTTSTYTYGHGQHLLVIPPDVDEMEVKVWGAGGNSSAGASGPCGRGGYTEAVFNVSEGSTYRILAGGRGSNGGFFNTGFKGITGGGGLSGLFTGSATVTENDSARAFVIAGGGGGASNADQAQGNSLSSGGQGTMRGAPNNSTGGGGGYAGGNLSTGGSGFVDASATSFSIESYPSSTNVRDSCEIFGEVEVILYCAED